MANSLEQSLSDFTNTKLNEKFSCLECKKHTKADETTYFSSLPRYLLFQSKRFKEEEDKFVKLNSRSSYNIDLNMARYSENGIGTHIKGNDIYELVSVVIHVNADEMHSGSFATYSKRGDNWTYFKDEDVVQNVPP